MKRNYIYSLAATFITAALALGSFTACSEDLVAEKSKSIVKEAPVCYFNLPASFDNGAETRAVTIGESTATSSFEASDKVYVYIERASDTPAFGYDAGALTPLTISNINGKTCDLSGALKFYHEGSGSDYEAYTPQENDRVHLLYNQNGNLDNPVYPYYEFYSMSGDKDGYIDMGYFNLWGANHYDFAEAVMKVTAVSGDAGTGYSLTLGKVDDPTDTQVSFKSLQSMFRQRLSFTDKVGDPATPTITKFRVSSTNNKIVYSYYPFYDNNTQRYEYQPLEIGDPYNSPVISGDGDIYFPLMFNDENKNDALIFTAYDNAENVYSLTKNAPASGFANGKYYYGGATLAWHHNMRPTVTGTTATPSYGDYTIDDNPVNITISGYSENYGFELKHGGSVTLNNVTATHTSTFMREYVSPAEDLLVVLAGTNSIKASPFYCINVDGGGSLKLSCTGASATLTVTVPYSSGCGIYGANYQPSNVSSDPTANRNDITTEYNVSAQLAAPGFTVTRSARVDGPDADTDGSPDYYTWTYTVRKSGEFSVSDNKKVYFSPGNLQATTTDYGTHWTWAFAANQWNYIGYAIANKKINGNGTVSDNGTVDLFGWVGASSGFTGAAMYGISIIENNGDYGNVAEENLKRDWGETIGTGWRTLTKDEWVWLLGPTISPDPGTNCRTSSTVGGTANGRYAKATVNSVLGLILFPDSYTHPDGLTAPASVNTNNAAYNANNYDATAWGKMEAAGAVFLPAAGGRSGNKVTFYGENGSYWSSSSPTSPVNNAYYMYFTAGNVKPDDYSGRRLGLSVRLVYNAN